MYVYVYVYVYVCMYVYVYVYVYMYVYVCMYVYVYVYMYVYVYVYVYGYVYVYIYVYVLTGYWIALDDQNVEDDFVWTLTGQQPTYTLWSGSQPDNDNNQDCVAISGQDGWDDLNCYIQRYFLCEYEYWSSQHMKMELNFKQYPMNNRVDL